MKRLGVLCLLLVLAVSGAALAQPDLVVTSLGFEPQAPRAGDSVALTATVRNVGTERVNRAFSVRFVADGTPLETPLIPVGLEAGSSKTVSVVWQATLGPHKIEVTADQPFDKVDESNESNNTLVATVTVAISPVTSPALAELRVAVARFQDRSGSGFLDVGEGMSDELSARLTASGLHILQRGELEVAMRAQGLDPSQVSDLVAAAGVIGADVLVAGTVTELNVQQATLSFGFAGFRSATAAVSATAQLVSAYTGEAFGSVSAAAQEQGATPEWLDLGRLVTLLQPPTAGTLCSGGLLTNRASYAPGEAVRVGYLNSGPAGWYWVEIDTFSGSFVRLLGGQFVSAGACKEWTWDQRDALLLPVAPGTYVAKLWDGGSFIAAATFQVSPGVMGPVPFGAITVGSTAFTDSLIGEATASTLNQLASGVIRELDASASFLVSSRAAMGGEEMTTTKATDRPLEGQVAGILPDGRVAINLGTEDGVARGDFLQVLDTINVVQDTASGAILSYDTVGVRGEIVVSEARERASIAVRTTDFPIAVGDIARRISP